MPERHAKRLQGWSPQAEAKPAYHVDGRGRSCGCADGHVDLICIALSTSGGPWRLPVRKEGSDRSKPSQRWKGERDLPISEIITPRILFRTKIGVSVETKGLGSFKLMHGLAILMVPACATKPPTPRFGQADLNTTAIDRFQNVRYTASAALTATRAVPLNKCLSQGNEGWASVSAPEALWCSTAHAGLVIAALAGRLFPNGESDYDRVGQGGS
ncbi:hypothetical protein SNK03_000992 [Fusarium graminearum]